MEKVIIVFLGGSVLLTGQGNINPIFKGSISDAIALINEKKYNLVNRESVVESFQLQLWDYQEPTFEFEGTKFKGDINQAIAEYLSGGLKKETLYPWLLANYEQITIEKP